MGQPSLDFERQLGCALTEDLISHFWPNTRATFALNPLKALVELTHAWIVALTHAGCWLHHTLIKFVKGSWLVARGVSKLHTRGKTRLHYIENELWLLRDGAETDLS